MSRIVELTEQERLYMPESTHGGILATRALDDDALLSLARSDAFEVAHGGGDPDARAAYVQVIAKTGPRTNPAWITGRAVEEAYDRGLIDERELDWLSAR